MIIKRGSRLKGQLRRRTKSRDNSATPTREELTKAILRVYRRDCWNCACVAIALNTISKEFAKKFYGLLPVVINTIGQSWLGKPQNTKVFLFVIFLSFETNFPFPTN